MTSENTQRGAPRRFVRDFRRPSRHRRPQRRGARHRRQDGLGLRRAAQHHRQGRGGRAPDRRAAGPRRHASCATSSARRRASSGSSARSRRASRPRCTASASRASASCPRTSASIRTREAAAHVLGFANVDNVGIAGIEKYIDSRACRISTAQASTSPPPISSPSSSPSICACSTPCATSLQKGMAKFKAKAAAGVDPGREHGRDHRPRVAAGLRSQQPGRRAREGPHQPHQCRRVRDGLDLQGADRRDGARFRQVQHQLDLRCALGPALRQASPSATITPRTASSPMPEVFVHSSNIGTARMALGIGVEGHKAFLRKMGQLDAPRDGAAGERRADRSAALGRAQHHDHRLRPRPRRRAAAGIDGGRRAGERRRDDHADLPQAR